MHFPFSLLNVWQATFILRPAATALLSLMCSIHYQPLGSVNCNVWLTAVPDGLGITDASPEEDESVIKNTQTAALGEQAAALAIPLSSLMTIAGLAEEDKGPDWEIPITVSESPPIGDSLSQQSISFKCMQNSTLDQLHLSCQYSLALTASQLARFNHFR